MSGPDGGGGPRRAERPRERTAASKRDTRNPRDSELLWDCVPVTLRLLGQARELPRQHREVFGDRTLRAQRRRTLNRSSSTFHLAGAKHVSTIARPPATRSSGPSPRCSTAAGI